MNKKKLSKPKNFLFPMPAVIVGSLVENKANFCTVAYCGIVNYEPPMISIECASSHYTTEGILKNEAFSVNIPSSKMIEATDYIGINSGRKVDKSKIFSIFYGERNDVPLIEEAPVNLECKLVKIIELGGNRDLFIGEIVNTYVNEDCFIGEDLSIDRIDPLIYSTSDKNYWSIGKKLGKAWEIGQKFTNQP